MVDREELAEDVANEQEARNPDEEEDEELDLDESDLKELAEKLTFEYTALSSGYASGIPVPELEQLQLVQQVQKDIEEANKEKDDLKESLDNLNKENQKFRKIILQLKDKLDEVSVSNARLLYTNRVLENPSLNERQKTKIVETISKAQTIEKAKMIYEALQSAVDGTISKREKPESLNEVVSRPSTMVFSNRREERQQSDHVLTRMQRLAGIKKS
jgi:DNA repair ATPase RecN